MRELGPVMDTFAMVPPAALGDLAMDPPDPLPIASATALHHVHAAMSGNPGFVIPIDTTTGGPAERQEPDQKPEDYGVCCLCKLDRRSWNAAGK